MQKVNVVPSKKYHHIGHIDLEGNGIMTECAIVKRDTLGNVYFFRIDNLDDTDLRRVFKIVNNRNAPNFELWDLMSQVTLGNGMNALEYFHQLVKIISPRGQIFKPQIGRTGTIGVQPENQPRVENDSQSVSSEQSAPKPAPKRPAPKKATTKSKSPAK